MAEEEGSGQGSASTVIANELIESANLVKRSKGKGPSGFVAQKVV